ncbi:MAG: CooT family nickel-binding protein [Pseudomonadota bacterium]
MCEASAYIVRKDGREELLLEGVDVIEPEEDGIRIVSIFGEQKYLRARLKAVSLVHHKIVLEEAE